MAARAHRRARRGARPGDAQALLRWGPGELAAAQLAAHRRRLRAYEQLRADAADWPRGWRLALEAGIGHERESIRFWARMEP